jgi:hypothetical protein
MPQQILRAAPLVVRLARNGELHLVAFRRERPHNGGTRRRWREHEVRIVVHSGSSTGRHRSILQRLRHRKLADGRRHRGPRAQARHNVLDVALALLTSLVQNLAVVVRGQMGRQQRDRRQRHRAVAQQIENDREPAGGPRCLDPPVGRVLREMQHLRAIGEERRAALAEVQSSLVAGLKITDIGGGAWDLRRADGAIFKNFDNRDDAEAGLAVARLHTQLCYIGKSNTRPDRGRYIMEYWK